jgi:DNA replication protein DnaC
MTATTKPVAPTSVAPLAADLDAALRRLKLATVRRNAAEVLQVAKTQRWTPEEVLRTLVEAEIAARDASNTANRLKAAAFPVTKSLDGFDVGGSSVTQATFDYLTSLEWVRGQQNLAIIGPPGTGKSHLLIGCGHAAVDAGFKVRYFTAADLIETLYRGLADNTVGKIIDTLLRADVVILDEIGFAPLDDSRGGGPPASARSTTRLTVLCVVPHSQTELANHPHRGGDFSRPPAATSRWSLTEGNRRDHGGYSGMP